MGAVVVVIAIGAILFALDLLANLFSGKKAESYKRISFPSASAVTADLEGNSKDFSYFSLPASVRENYKFREFRYEKSDYRYYNPRPSAITSGQPATWAPRSKRYEGRSHSPSGTVRATDLVLFQDASVFSLIDQLDEDILQAESAIGNYPAARPQVSGGVVLPEQPKPVSIEGILSPAETDALSAKDASYVRGFLESVNEKRTSVNRPGIAGGPNS